MKNLERTFVMVKPHAIEFANEILEELDEHGLRKAFARVERVPREVIEEHYKEHEAKPFFGDMTSEFVGNPVVIAVYTGEEVVQRMRKLVGKTNPMESSLNSIRGKYRDKIDVPIRMNLNDGAYVLRSIVHASTSVDEAKKEIEVWKRYLSGLKNS